MPRIVYKRKRFGAPSLAVINEANGILDEYAEMGFDLTLRQLYYQFVARGLIANRQAEYDKLGKIVNDARMAGMIDWDHIVDRTRELKSIGHWKTPAEIVQAVSKQFAIDKWADQPERVEVWIEKDALVGVIEGVCRNNDVAYFSCRGYASQSEMWGAAQRLGKYLLNGQSVTILHLGDHDPSGIDMTRDIEERLFTFLANDYWRANDTDDPEGNHAVHFVNEHFQVERLALNMDQVEEHDPPPNPAKLTDSRARGYVAEHGDESWELDALPPDAMAELIGEAIDNHRDDERWQQACAKQDANRAQLAKVSARWPEVVALVAS